MNNKTLFAAMQAAVKRVAFYKKHLKIDYSILDNTSAFISS